jgi:acetyltransferase
MTEADMPKIAIRPYPSQYVSAWTMKDGRKATIRPIRAEDEPLVIQFHETLSDRSVYLRYLSPMMLSQRVTHERMARICHNDYDREIALVVEGETQKGDRQIFAMGRMSKLHGEENEGRVTMLVSDQFQGQGIGGELLKRLIHIGRAEKISRLLATISPENIAMQKLCEGLGFTMQTNAETHMIEAELPLNP